MSGAGVLAEDISIYRALAHKFKWRPEEVDKLDVPLVAALMHDIEAERVRIEDSRKDMKGKKEGLVKSQRWTVDDARLPLSVKLKPLFLAAAWINKWNAAHPGEKPIPMPEVVTELDI